MEFRLNAARELDFPVMHLFAFVVKVTNDQTAAQLLIDVSWRTNDVDL